MSASRWRFRPRPATTVAAIAFCALTVSLGNWQLRRAEEREGAQRQLEARAAGAAVALPTDAVDPAEWAWRRVSARGAYVDAHTILLDNRVLDGRAGFHVVTPLRLAGTDMHVLVNRGWAPQGRTRADLPRIPAPAGTHTVEGIVVTPPERVFTLGDAAPTGAVWQHLAPGRYGERTGLAVQPIVLLQTSAADDGLVRRWERPDAGADKNRAYALQWYVFAALALVLYVALNLKRVRAG
ncbi:MAG: SURF1 family protein [Burkholderiales bacterium]|nr:SURF1 family protein [Burkholderiales bacterium]